MSDNVDTDEREHIDKNDGVKVYDIVEDLKVGKLSLHKYLDNVETGSDKTNLVDISEEKDSVEGDAIHKNDNVTLTDVDKESEEIYKRNTKEQDGLELKKSETDERDQIEISDLLKRIYSQKKETMMI